MEEEILEEKTLTLKSLEKKMNERFAIIEQKLNLIERNIEVIKNVSRRVKK